MFSIDTALNGMAGKRDVFLCKRQGMSSGNSDLLAHQINPGNGFGDWVFNLQSGVHFDKEEFAILKQKLHGAYTKIAHFASGLSRNGADFVTHLSR